MTIIIFQNLNLFHCLIKHCVMLITFKKGFSGLLWNNWYQCVIKICISREDYDREKVLNMLSYEIFLIIVCKLIYVFLILGSLSETEKHIDYKEYILISLLAQY